VYCLDLFATVLVLNFPFRGLKKVLKVIQFVFKKCVDTMIKPEKGKYSRGRPYFFLFLRKASGAECL
jgi:hypothetical protein